MVFAQAGGGFGGNRPNQEIPPEFMPFLIIFVVVILAIGITVQIFYLLTLYRCYSQIGPRNRRMEPGMVWLNLIPCFNLIWIFFTTIRLADSLREEFAERRLPGDNDYGRSLGIAYPALALAGAIPLIGGIFSIAALVCWILYWVKIAGYNRQLREDRPEGVGGQDWPEDNYDREKYDDGL